MPVGRQFILLCAEHMLPGEDPSSWHCRWAAFRDSSTGHVLSLGVQFLLYFAAIMFLHWLFVSRKRPNPGVGVKAGMAGGEDQHSAKILADAADAS